MSLAALYRRKVLNQKKSLEEFDRGALELESRPSKVIVELNKYELWRHARPSQAAMPLELFKKTAAALFGDAYFVDLRGFETPSVAPIAHAVLDECARHPLVNWHLFTHLTLKDPTLWPKIAKLGFMLGFACDGVTRESTSAVRPTADFELTMRNIELAAEAIADAGRGFIYMIVTIQRENMRELPAIMRLAKQHGIRQVQFKVLKDFTDAAAASGSLGTLVNECLEFALANAIRLSINDQELFQGVEIAKIVRAMKQPIPDPALNFPPPGSLDPEFTAANPWNQLDVRVIDRARVSVYKNCFKPYHFAHIAPDGVVGTCNHMLDPYIVEMGDLKTTAFADIWNGPKYQAFRKALMSARPTDPRCKWCFEHRLTD